MSGRALLAVVVVFGGLALLWVLVVRQTALPEVEDPAANRFEATRIERGRVLAAIGNCVICHTTRDGDLNAGGVALPTAFGTFHTPNITPDPEHGIGRWSEEAFVRAMRSGVDRSGRYLFPAFPYDHFTRVRDEDLKAIYAWVMTRKPSDTRPPDHELRFPFDIRLLQAGWQLLFLDDARFEPDPARSEQWNRGAYLAEGLGHCGACHTPRNRFGAEKAGRAYAGAVIDDWYAPALSGRPTAPMPWTEDALHEYLQGGGTALHGVAVGSMAPIIHAGLAEADDADLRALAVYFASMDDRGGSAGPSARERIAAARERARRLPGRGEHLFAVACASCHYNPADDPRLLRPELSLNSAVTAPDPVNLIRVTLDGVSLDAGVPGVMMPGFASLDDAEIASLVTWLRSTQTELEPWGEVEARVRDLRP